jgi:hypothetical protein
LENVEDKFMLSWLRENTIGVSYLDLRWLRIIDALRLGLLGEFEGFDCDGLMTVAGF